MLPGYVYILYCVYDLCLILSRGRMEDFILTKQQDQQVILLADDEDDVLLFKEVLASKSEELSINISLHYKNSHWQTLFFWM